MKKYIPKRVFITMFLTTIFLPPIIWLFVGESLNSADYENRDKVQKPVFSINEFDVYSVEYEKYYNDHLPFRNQLIKMNSSLDYYVFHRSSNADVIIGKDEWLFYANTADGNPIACYRGENLYSDEELLNIANNLIRTRDYLENRGIEFVLFIAPNKERIYADMMPDYYGEPAENYAALQVVNYLRENTDIRVVYPYNELMETKNSNPSLLLYHKADTHWNQAGAYIGSRALLKELGIELPDIDSDQIAITETDNTLCDLADMINLRENFIGNENDYIISGYDDHNVENEKWDPSAELVYHCENADSRTLFIYRDTYAKAMSWYLGSQFNESYMIHKNVYSSTMLDEQNPDIFVYETVERYVGDLQYFSIE